MLWSEYFEIYLLSNLNTQCGARNHDPEIKGHMPFYLSQPGDGVFWICKDPTSKEVEKRQQLERTCS